MMKLFARILSHGFALIIVALLALGLMYRGKLFPEWELPDFLTFDTAEEQATGTVAGDVQRTEPEAGAEQAAPEAPAAAVTGAAPGVVADEPAAALSEAAEQAAEAPLAAQQPAAAAAPAESAAQLPEAPVPEQAPPPAEPAAPAAETPAAAAEAPAAEPEAPAAQPAPVAEAPQPAPVVPPASEASAYRILAAAREAYWLRDYAQAEQQYRELIALQPANPDGYGELGNMFFSQGNWEQAAAMYYEAGVRLVDEGYLREAQQMVEVIRGLNSPQAGDLEQKIQSARQ